MDPIYTPRHCVPRYQLNWGVSVFWREAMQDASWLADLSQVVEPDGVRILQHRFGGPRTSLFLVSTKPHVSPVDMIRSVKGRLQHLIGPRRPKAFRRKFSFRSVGSATREEVEKYVAEQHSHHPMVDPAVQELLSRYVLHSPGVDLSKGRTSGHSLFWYGLHIVLVNDCRWCEVDRQRLDALFQMISHAAAAKGHLLSRASILADHVHLVLGASPAESPEAVALGYLNNLAYAVGMRPVFQFSYFAGTVGEYDVWVPGMGRR